MRRVALMFGYVLLAAALKAAPLVRFHTALGDMVFELLDKTAPLTTSNFLAHLNRGDYKDGLIDQILPPSAGAFIATCGHLAVTNRGLDTADFVALTSNIPLVSESLLTTSVPNQAGTLSMRVSGAPYSVDTNGNIVVATNSDPLRFVINLANNSILDPQISFSGTNLVRIPGYTVFGRLVAGIDTFEILRQFAPTRTPETNLLVSLIIPPPINSTNLNFPVLSVNRTAIDQGRLDFADFTYLDLSVFTPATINISTPTGGTTAISWVSSAALTNSLRYTSQLSDQTADRTNSLHWQVLTNLVNTPGVTNVYVDHPGSTNRFYDVLVQ